MKKLIMLLAVCGFAVAFVACAKKAETAEETAAPAVEEVVDSAAVVVDSAAAVVDSVAAQ
mgnify:FL=1|jgi:hypothetical protein